MRTSLRGVGNDVNNLASRLSPLTGRISGFIAALVGARAIEESLDAAERQVQAEASLLAALKGRVDQLERIKIESAEIQGLTIEGDEALLETAALLVNMGVAASEIPRSLEAAVDTAAALQVPVEQVAKAIGLFQAGLAGELGERISELKELQAEGRLATDGVDLLLSKFSGAGAALAQTPFGRATQLTNELGDEMERVGSVAIELRNRFLTGLVAAIRQFADAVNRPETRGLARIFGELLERGTRLVAVVALIVAGIALIKLGAFVAPVVFLLGKLGVIATIVGAVGKGVLEATGALAPVQREVGSIADRVRDLFEAVADGRISVNTLFELVLVRFKQVGVAIDSFVVDPIAAIITNTVNRIDSLFKLGRDSLKSIGVSIQRFVGVNFDEVAQKAFKALNAVVGFFQGVFEFVKKRIDDGNRRLDQIFGAAGGGDPDSQESVLDKNLLGGLSEKEVQDLQKTQDELTASIEKQVERLDGLGFRDVFDKIKDDVTTGLAEIEALNEEARRIKGEIAEGLSDEAAAEALRERQREILNDLRDTERRIDAVFGDAASRLAENFRLEQPLLTEGDLVSIDVAEIRSRIEVAARDGLRAEVEAFATDDLLRLLEERRVTIGRFADIQAALGAGTIEEQVEAQRRIVDAISEENIVRFAGNELLEAEAALRRAIDAEVRDPDQILDAQREVLRIKNEEVEALDRQNRAQEQLRRLEVEREARLRAVDQNVAAGAAALVESEEATIESLLATLDQTAASVRAGLLTAAEGVEVADTAIDQFKGRIGSLREDVEQLAARSPRLADELEVVLQRIDELERTRPIEIRAEFASSLVADIEAAQQALSQRRLELAVDIDAGDPTALREIAALTEALRTRVANAIAAIEQLTAESPEAGAAVSGLLTQLRGLQTGLEGPEPLEATDFFGGVIQGAQQAAGEFNNLAVVGARVGSSLVSQLGEGLIDVFVRGRQSFREFLSSFLAGIGEMILKLLLFQAISAALPGGAVAGNVFATLFAGRRGGEVPAPEPVLTASRGGIVDRAIARFKNGGDVAASALGRTARLVQRFAAGGMATLAAKARSSYMFVSPRITTRSPLVPGAVTHDDVVPALVRQGEYWHPPETVSHYGRAVMNAIRTRAIPRNVFTGMSGLIPNAAPVLDRIPMRFNQGGEVAAPARTPPPSAGAMGFQQAIIVSDRQAANRMFNGGQAEMLQWLRNNRPRALNALGLKAR